MSTPSENKTFVDVLAAAQTGDKVQILQAIEDFRITATKRLLSPWFVGPIAVIYAFKGKLSPFERAVLGLVGVGAMVNQFLITNSQVQPGQEAKWVHPLTQFNQATPSQQSLPQSSVLQPDGQKSTT